MERQEKFEIFYYGLTLVIILIIQQCQQQIFIINYWIEILRVSRVNFGSAKKCSCYLVVQKKAQFIGRKVYYEFRES